MAEFLGDIAFVFEILVLGIGLLIIYYGKKENSKLVRFAGYMMSAISILALTCTTFFYFKYYLNGEFDTAYPTQVIMDNK
ncbi:MAG: hypothetical protein CME70_11075 [Halobacteriovorax sp.]|nr:hypothetical protein [Halobacteriovorax sp.]|tara:strand:- start:15346 stop:15585 length:240 start_codon:yes stop_codon:yes gene_type:complete